MLIVQDSNLSEKLEIYRQITCANHISNVEMMRYIAAGHELSRQILQNCSITLDSELEACRSLMWHMLREAGAQDQLFDDSVILFRETAFYSFLRKLNLCTPRTSTHFKSHGRLQYNIEDPENKLPAGMGCILFGQLRDETIFIKLEHVGVSLNFSRTSFKRNLKHLRFYFFGDPPRTHRQYHHTEHAPSKVKKAFANAMYALDQRTTSKKVEGWQKEGIAEMRQILTKTVTDHTSNFSTEAAEKVAEFNRITEQHLRKYAPYDHGIPRYGNEVHLDL